MQIAVLGPLEVRDDDGSPVDVGGSRLRTLLILLALDPGRVVTSRRLIDQLWDGDPPSTAANALQALVSRLRKLLPDGTVQGGSAGYRLAVDPSVVDAGRFESMVFAGRELLSHDPDAGIAMLTRADALWRGPALVDADDREFVRAPRARLEELRLAATEDRIRAALDSRTGNPAALVTELEPLIVVSPLRESLVELLMRALHAAGRPADALAAYERARAALADALGADPSPALAERHLTILRDEAPAAGKGNLICRALDGMPLAIELAAARLSSLTPAQVADRLDDRFRLLTRGSRTALPRHRTLRAVVDWSWDLLDDGERLLLRRLSVFAGGATVEAAAYVCGLSVPDALDGLTALADKSLLVPNGTRFGMLETIRAYAREQLAAAEDPVGAAHTAYFLALAEDTEPHLRRAEQLPWLARLAAEHDNFNAAIRRAIADGDPDTAHRFVAALGWYWWLRGHRAESSELAAEALRLPGAADSETRAISLAFAALIGFESMRDADELRGWFAEALEMAERLELTHPMLLIAKPLETLVTDAPISDVLAQLRPVLDCDDPWAAAMARVLYAHTLLNTGNRQAESEEHFRAALAGFRLIGERFGMSMALAALGETLGRRGDHAAAVPYFEEALVHQAQLDAVDDHPQTLVWLALEVYLLGDHARAADLVEEAHSIAERLGAADTIGWALHTRARFASLDGDHARARTLYAEAEALLAGQRVSPHLTAVLHSGLGLSDVDAGDLPGARRHFVAALDSAASSFDAPILGEVIVRLAGLALAEDRPEVAAELLTTARTTRGQDESLPEAARFEAEVARRLGTALRAPAQDREVDLTAVIARVRDLAGIEDPRP